MNTQPLIYRIGYAIRNTLRSLVLMCVAFVLGYNGAEFVEDEPQ